MTTIRQGFLDANRALYEGAKIIGADEVDGVTRFHLDNGYRIEWSRNPSNPSEIGLFFVWEGR